MATPNLTVASLVYSNSTQDFGAGTFEVTATFSSAVSPTSAAISITGGAGNGSNQRANQALTDANPGTDTIFTFTYILNGGGVDDGAFAIDLTATEVSLPYNQLSAQAANSTFTVHTVPPTAAITFSHAPLPAGTVQVTVTYDVTVTNTPAFGSSVGAGGGTLALGAVEALGDSKTFVFPSATIGGTGDSTPLTVTANGAVDDVGNTQTVATVGTATIDAAPPTASLTYNKSSHAYKDTDDLTITAAFNENITPTAPAITITGGNVGGTGVVNVAMTHGPDLQHWTYHTVIAKATDPEGPRTVTLAAADLAGNALVAQPTNNTFSVDWSPPTASLTYNKLSQAYADADDLTMTAVFNENITPTAPAITITGGNVGGTGVANVPMTQGADLQHWTYHAVIAKATDPEGPRTVTLAAADLAGNALVAQPTSSSFSVDWSPPTASLTYNKSSQAYKDADDLTITAVFNENITPTAPAITITGGNVGGTGVANVPMTQGADLQHWTYHAVIAKATDPDGARTVTVAGSDPAGNSNTSTGNGSFTVDSTAPNVYLTYNKSSQAYKDVDTLIITAAFDENITPTAPAITIGGGDIGGADVSGAAMTQGADLQHWTYQSVISKATDPAGGRSVTVVGDDLAGNPNTSTGNPAFSLIYTPPPAPVVNVQQSPPGTADTVNGTAQANTTIKVYTNSSKTTQIVQGSADGSGNWGPLSIGDNQYPSVFVTATDAAGNEGAGTTASNDIDNPTAPSLSFSKGPQYITSGPMAVTAVYNETEGIGTAPALSFAGVGGPRFSVSSPTKQGLNTFVFNVTVSGATSQAGDLYSATVAGAKDLYGNPQAAAASFSGTVDTVPPTATLSFNKGTTPYSPGPFTVTATFIEMVQATPRITISNGTVGGAAVSGVAMSGSGKVWTYTTTIQSTDTNGVHAVTLAALDLAGNLLTVQPSPNTFTIDVVPPTVTLTFSHENRLYRAEPFAVSAAFSKPLLDTPTITIAGGTIGGSTVSGASMSGSGTVWTYATTILSSDTNGLFTVTLAATDPAGNALTPQPSNNTFTVKTVPPTAPVVNVAQNPPGTADTVSGTAEANATIRVYTDSTKSAVIVSGPVDAGGNWGPLSIGDNLHASVFVTATDPEGNEGAGTSAANDIKVTGQISFQPAITPAKAGPLQIVATFDQPLGAAPPSITIHRGTGGTTALADVVGALMSATARATQATYSYPVFPSDGVRLFDYPLTVAVSAVDDKGNTTNPTATLALDTHLSFQIPLVAGVNFISLPVQPAPAIKASTLVGPSLPGISATFVIATAADKTGLSRFNVFLPGGPVSADFTLGAGSGYIVDVPRPVTLTIAGATAWPLTANTLNFPMGPQLVGLTSVLSSSTGTVATQPAKLTDAQTVLNYLGADMIVTRVRDANGNLGFGGAISNLSLSFPGNQPPAFPVKCGVGYIINGAAGLPSAGSLPQVELPVPVFPGFNQPPVIASLSATPPGNFTYPETGAIQLTVQANDAEGDPLTYEWRQTEGPPGTFTSDNKASTSFVLTARGDLGFIVIVRDGKGGETQRGIQVQMADRPPATPQIAKREADPIYSNTTVDLTVTAPDPDNDPITYRWSIQPPSGVQPSSTTAPTGTSYSVSIPVHGTGVWTATAVATDNGGVQSTSSFPFTVVNEKPVARFVRTDMNALVVPATLSFDGSGSTDADGDAVTYSWTVTPATAGVAFSNASGAKTTLTFPHNTQGTYTVSLVVTDDGTPATSSDAFAQQYTVNLSTAPSVTINDVQVTASGDGSIPNTLTAAGTSPNGETLTYSWKIASGPTPTAGVTELQQNATQPWLANFTPTRPGLIESGANDYTIHVTVTDVNGLSTSTTKTFKPRYLKALGGTPATYQNLVDGPTPGAGSILVQLPAAPTVLFSRTEVSNQKYKLFAALPTQATTYQPDLTADNLPVVGVTLDQAKAYAAFAGMEVPTEDEWLTAATGVAISDPANLPSGTRIYPWGNDVATIANGRADFVGTYSPAHTASVDGAGFLGSTPDTGIVHLGGNAAEWTTTQDPSTGANIARGGSWESLNLSLTNGLPGRLELSQSDHNLGVGVRCLVHTSNPSSDPRIVQGQ